MNRLGGVHQILEFAKLGIDVTNRKSVLVQSLLEVAHSAFRFPGMIPVEMLWQRPISIHAAAPPLG